MTHSKQGKTQSKQRQALVDRHACPRSRLCFAEDHACKQRDLARLPCALGGISPVCYSTLSFHIVAATSVLHALLRRQDANSLLCAIFTGSRLLYPRE